MIDSVVENKAHKRNIKIFWVIGIFVLIAAIGLVFYLVGVTKDKPQTNLSGNPATLGSRDERFGFLSGPDDLKQFADAGAGFIRPHPEPFVWGSMQEDENSKIDFGKADKLVKEAQKNNLKVLATLMPYAGWDQVKRADKDACIVQDEFSGGYGESLLGEYRCNPSDWSDYEKWVQAVVERYDGDGTDDMPGLSIPIKHWEVNNEPDLQPPPEKENGLRFFIGGPVAYGKLLKKTYAVVKKTDRQAKVLIAGAAGGNDQFLDFYRKLFVDKDIKNYFDIANVHCISNDDYASFNVEPYKKMLSEFDIEKPIWVTEAEAFVSSDSDVNAAQVKASTIKALQLGAEKIFYTNVDFEKAPGGSGPKFPESVGTKPDPFLDGDNPVNTYKKIFESVPK